MSNVEFNDQQKYYNQGASNQGSGVANWMIKNKIAKDESGAQKLMLTVIIICFAITGYILFIK